MNSSTGDIRPTVRSAGAVRDRILEEHRAIRAHLLKVQGLVPGAARGIPGTYHDLVEAASDLVRTFRAHLATEDRVLAPVLETIDAWGPVRRERLEDEHRRQREELEALAEQLRNADRFDPDLVAAVDALVAELLADMEEERHVLSDQLLRDDVVVVGQTDG